METIVKKSKVLGEKVFLGALSDYGTKDSYLYFWTESDGEPQQCFWEKEVWRDICGGERKRYVASLYTGAAALAGEAHSWYRSLIRQENEDYLKERDERFLRRNNSKIIKCGF